MGYVVFLIFSVLLIKALVNCDWDDVFKPKPTYNKYTSAQMRAIGNRHGLRVAKRQMRRMWK